MKKLFIAAFIAVFLGTTISCRQNQPVAPDVIEEVQETVQEENLNDINESDIPVIEEEEIPSIQEENTPDLEYSDDESQA